MTARFSERLQAKSAKAITLAGLALALTSTAWAQSTPQSAPQSSPSSTPPASAPSALPAPSAAHVSGD